MTRRFRPLQESIDICTQMLLRATYYGDVGEIKYWIDRRKGYAMLARQKGIPVKVTNVSVQEESQ
jgi:hypothetical protein